MPTAKMPAVRYTWEQFDRIVDAAWEKHDPIGDGEPCMIADNPLTDEQMAADFKEAMTTAGVPLPENADAETLLGCFFRPEALAYFREEPLHLWNFWEIVAYARKQAKFEKASLPLTLRQIEIGAGPQIC